MPKLSNRFSIILGFLVVFLITAASLVYSFTFDRSPEPNSVQIQLSEVGVVADFKFEVKKHFPYRYSMNFRYPENDQVERVRVRKLIGDFALDKSGKPLEPGVPTPIELTIFAICRDGKELVVYSQSVDPMLTSWGDGYFGKTIGNSVLSPGAYRARLVNKRASPEFNSLPITFEMGMPAKVNFNPVNQPATSGSC
jgi:Domain of unknown function (DUF5625)